LFTADHLRDFEEEEEDEVPKLLFDLCILHWKHDKLIADDGGDADEVEDGHVAEVVHDDCSLVWDEYSFFVVGSFEFDGNWEEEDEDGWDVKDAKEAGIPLL
jgi:hypothetical protein